MTDPDPAGWVTYRRSDGEPIGGEYAFVTELEWFDMDTEPTELIKETWTLISSETITVGPTWLDEEDDDE